MDKEKLMDLVNTDFNKFQLEIKRFYKEDYVVKLERQVKKQKEIIDKAVEFINSIDLYSHEYTLNSIEINDLLDILKEVSE